MASWGRNILLAASVVASGAAATIVALSAADADDLSKGIPSREALQRKTALKLAGLATFVASSCPGLRLDPDRFKSAVTALGMTTKDLDDKTTRVAFLGYTMAYKQDVKANCARAQTQFGPQGKTLPDLFQVVEIPAKPPAAGTPPAENAAPALAPGGGNKP